MTVTVDSPVEQTTASDVLATLGALGLTYRMLDYWTRAGYLVPVSPSRPGSGHVRAYPPSEVAVCAAMLRLIAFGFTPATAALFARQGEAQRWVRIRMRGGGFYADAPLWDVPAG